jgi:hypothetical protein
MEYEMTKTEALQIIQDLYPPDDKHKPTAEIGKEIMDEVLYEMWREQHPHILMRMATKMREYESSAYFRNKYARADYR